MTELLDHVEADRGPASRTGGAGRTRMCALTRAVLPEGQLIRFVADPDGGVVADLRAKLPGRGIWIGAERASVAGAVKKNVFARALKKPVRPAADLPEQVAARLREAALGRLGLARKAGAALAGFAKVEAAAGRDGLLAIVTASDAAEDGRRKMEGALRRRPPGLRAPEAIGLFTSAELSLAMGLPNVIHAAVLHSPAGKSFAEAAFRLLRYEGVGGSQSSDDRADEPQDTTE